MIRHRVLATIAAVVFMIFALVQRRLLARYGRGLRHITSIDDASVNSSLFQHLRHMQKLALPTLLTREGCGSMAFIALFALKAFANIMKSEADGRIIEAMVTAGSKKGGQSRQSVLMACFFRFFSAMLLSAGVTSAIEHLRFWLIASYRERLTSHFHSKFFNRLTYYYGSQLDDRLEAADTVIPVYCHEFAEHFAELPYYFVMPFFEAVTALVVVVRRLGPKPAGYLIGSVSLSLFALRALTPPFGKIHALLLNREEAFRRTHADVHANVEQVAFLAGGGSVRDRANRSFSAVAESLKHMAAAKGHFQLVESTINGCWEMMGLLLSNMLINTHHATTSSSSSPVVDATCQIGTGRRRRGGEEVTMGGGAGRHVLSAVVMQRRLVQDFHQAVTALVVNVKEVSHLSEFTEKLALFDATLDSVARGELVIKRNIVDMQHDDQQLRLEGILSSGVRSPVASSVGTLDCQEAEEKDRDEQDDHVKELTSPSSCSLQIARDTWNIPELHRTRSGFVGDGAAAEGGGAAVASTDDDFLSPLSADWDVSRLSPALGQATYLDRSVVCRPSVMNDAHPPPFGLSPPVTTSATPPFGTSPNPNPTPSHANTPVLVRLKNITVANPHGRVLVPDLTLSLREGDRWAIIGPNGSGKSSILRVLAKMWLPTAGVVETSRSVRYLFLPQSPYFPPSSTISEQITFPRIPKLVPDTLRTVAAASSMDPTTTASTAVSRKSSTTPTATALGNACNQLSSKYGFALDRLLTTVTSVVGAHTGGVAGNNAQSSSSTAAAGDASSLVVESNEEVLGNNIRLRSLGIPLMVCPKQQRRMREAVSLATATQLLEGVFGGWGSPVAGLLDPHMQWSGSEEDVASAAAAVKAAAVSPEIESSPGRAWGSLHTHRGEVLAVGADRSFDWYSLSGGQQQKLSLARMFYHILRFQEEGDVAAEATRGDSCEETTPLSNPNANANNSTGNNGLSGSSKSTPAFLSPSQVSPVVVMDESTSQMDFTSEDLVFKHLSKKNVTLVSVTHRPEVIDRHDHILEIVLSHVDVPTTPSSLLAGRRDNDEEYPSSVPPTPTTTQSVVVPSWSMRRHHPSPREEQQQKRKQ